MSKILWKLEQEVLNASEEILVVSRRDDVYPKSWRWKMGLIKGSILGVGEVSKLQEQHVEDPAWEYIEGLMLLEPSAEGRKTEAEMGEVSRAGVWMLFQEVGEVF